MILIYESPSLNPYENLALEEHLLNTLPPGARCILFWRNAPSVVIGKNQNALEEINEIYVRQQGILIARRISGGGAVYHDEGNLNYSVIEISEENKMTANEDLFSQCVPVDVEMLQKSFRRYLEPVVQAMEQMGLHAEINGRNDITVGGKKVSGSAQYRREGRMLHHGCILVSADLDALDAALSADPAKYRIKGIRSVRSRVTSLSECAGRQIPLNEFKTQLASSFLQAFSDNALPDPEEPLLPADFLPHRSDILDICSEQIKMADIDRREIEKLRDCKYASEEWIYERKQVLPVRRQMRTDAGLITVDVHIQKGIIRQVFFSGDFFSAADVRELEAKLVGCRADRTLYDALAGMEISKYIHGVGAEVLYSMLVTH